MHADQDLGGVSAQESLNALNFPSFSKAFAGTYQEWR